MKKVLLVFVLFLILAGTVFADHPDNQFGIGLRGGWYGGWSELGFGHAGLSLKFPYVPVFWTVDFVFNSDNYFLNVAGDFYLIESPIISDINLHWYMGLGAWVNIGFIGDLDVSLGARLPIGLSWHFLNFLELFIDAAPSLGVQLVPKFYFPSGGWPIGIGVRFWL